MNSLHVLFFFVAIFSEQIFSSVGQLSGYQVYLAQLPGISRPAIRLPGISSSATRYIQLSYQVYPAQLPGISRPAIRLPGISSSATRYIQASYPANRYIKLSYQVYLQFCGIKQSKFEQYRVTNATINHASCCKKYRDKKIRVCVKFLHERNHDR